MQCFELPQSATNYLYKCNRDFVWKKSNTKKGLHVVTSDRICCPKKMGGLEFPKTEATYNVF